MRVMDAVLLLFNLKLDPVVMDLEKKSVTPSWSESLKLMSQTSFLQQLMNFPKVLHQFGYFKSHRKANGLVIIFLCETFTETDDTLRIDRHFTHLQWCSFRVLLLFL